MSNNKLIQNLKEFFFDFDKKLEAKVELINQNYKNDKTQINSIFKESNDENHISELNAHRTLLLKQLAKRIDKQLDAVNLWFENISTKSGNRLNNFNKERLYDFKKDFLYFTKTCQSKQVVLNKYKFTRPLDFVKIYKYSHLLVTGKELNMRIEKSFIMGCLDYTIGKEYEYIPNDKYLVNIINKEKRLTKVLIIKRMGDVLHSRSYYEEKIHRTELMNSGNIIIISEKEMHEDYFTIEVLDLKLDLIYSFKLDRDYYHKGVIINGNELVFNHDFLNLSLVCNIDRFKFKFINFPNDIDSDINKKIFCNDILIRLSHLNAKYLYYIISHQNHYDVTSIIAMSIYDRRSLKKIGFIQFDSTKIILSNTFEFDLDGNICAEKSNGKSIEIYSPTGQLIYSIRPNKFHFSQSGTVIFNKRTQSNTRAFDIL